MGPPGCGKTTISRLLAERTNLVFESVSAAFSGVTGLRKGFGAATENPSFELNGALLSRCQVFVLKRLDEAALETLVERAEQAIGQPLPLTADGRQARVATADGDDRYLLNLAEQLQTVHETLDVVGLVELAQ